VTIESLNVFFIEKTELLSRVQATVKEKLQVFPLDLNEAKAYFCLDEELCCTVAKVNNFYMQGLSVF
jgi:hypothetical protein